MSSRILAGRYELIEKIGEGGMAVVYKARCRLLNRFVAIKILKPEFTKDVKFIESFRRESQAAASLVHPNIVNVYDVGKEGNIHYIVMELIEGRVLSDLIKTEGPIEIRKAVSITKQIASALSLAHKSNLIHRDVKPHNILINQDGVAKITDFGIAKAVSSGTIVGKQTETIMGSVHYFSPEQARGGYIDEKSDIYSLGIVLYEMVTGKVPFDGENPVAVAVMHINDEMVPPSELVSDIPADLEEIILKATNKYQVNRYKSAEDMLTALNLINYNSIGKSAAHSKGKAKESTIVMPPIKNAGLLKENQLNNDAMGEKDEEKMAKEKGKKKKFKLNKVKFAAIVIALFCAIPISGFLVNGIRSMLEPDEVVVPDLKGYTFEEAEKKLEELKLVLEKGNEVYSSDYDEGCIVSQSPEEDMKIKEGAKVQVNISKGMQSGTVPNLVGKTLSEAEFVLETYGYEKGSVKEDYSDYAKGVVFEQSPESGSEADSGTKVSFKVSLGSKTEEVEMPNLKGLDFDRAKDQLTKYKLSLGNPSYDSSSSFAKNQVISQSIDAGKMVEEGTSVDLVISSGEEEASGKQGTVDLTISYSNAKNELLWLTVIVSDENGVSTPISREQRNRSDGSSIVSVSGEGKGTITVMFDNEVEQRLNVDFATGDLS
ncbi:Stk1 family PASTA domain-containing Ser/Thr kinase [Sinanaerobacter sp. ZZT-01]|uniref:Stk1 family PASTA domain-containing Ser/Thr kinase n=1 Tax=Sinanaerobacter sp. ZZT-01 TaxID=3111540 RepID=UPI002D78DE84|nr:Stk1 family PASTA domain-containing Ser/Thr kinase [Sinanaerobacter sp. ZZT-01]WRR92783.1 Stk1 family PASTA domain-containing Ser/Thr kinase [Sinanaerobacter sp. ZZT-01]